MQAWLDEIKFQQTIKEERKISYKQGLQKGIAQGARAAAIENAKRLFADGYYSAEKIAELLNIPVESFTDKGKNASMA